MTQGFQITSAAVSDRGLSEKRPQNEDSYLSNPTFGIFAVADGVGGAQAGEVASQMAMEILGEAFNNALPGSDAEQVMELALDQANAAIYQMSTELSQLAQMATTVVALHLDGNIATIGHAGDSRLYRLDRDGTLHRETEDHSVVADEVRAGRMTEEQAENHPAKNVINRALGAEPSVKLELKTKLVSRDCTYLLCSDGVTRHIPDKELAQILSGDDPNEICRIIKETCYQRGAEDNLTAVVIKYDGVEPNSAHHGPPVVEDDPAEFDTVASVRLPAEAVPEQMDEIQVAEHSPEPVVLAEPIEPATVDAVPAELSTAAPEPLPLPVQAEEPAPPITEERRGTDFTRDYVTAREADRERLAQVLEESPAERSGGRRTLIAALGALILGTAIGLGVYHFGFAEKPIEEPALPNISEMRSGNIAFTAFEENRRNVDKDPALYIERHPPPQDAADHYLLGRAYMLLGDFQKAKASFTEAKKLMDSSDESNIGVMRDDIILAEAVLADPDASAAFKRELEAAKMPKNAEAANTSR
ncbi:MAG TPA: protein phosphatase 2C domain-containing protein [Pyrinomonadaceae bacterium]|nr:protein phosphatase 2C domain-containing protein [Pyrinomonadaceae bacterium]